MISSLLSYYINSQHTSPSIFQLAINVAIEWSFAAVFFIRGVFRACHDFCCYAFDRVSNPYVAHTNHRSRLKKYLKEFEMYEHIIESNSKMPVPFIIRQANFEMMRLATGLKKHPNNLRRDALNTIQNILSSKFLGEENNPQFQAVSLLTFAGLSQEIRDRVFQISPVLLEDFCANLYRTYFDNLLDYNTYTIFCLLSRSDEEFSARITGYNQAIDWLGHQKKDFDLDSKKITSLTELSECLMTVFDRLEYTSLEEMTHCYKRSILAYIQYDESKPHDTKPLTNLGGIRGTTSQSVVYSQTEKSTYSRNPCMGLTNRLSDIAAALPIYLVGCSENEKNMRLELAEKLFRHFNIPGYELNTLIRQFISFKDFEFIKEIFNHIVSNDIKELSHFKEITKAITTRAKRTASLCKKKELRQQLTVTPLDSTEFIIPEKQSCYISMIKNLEQCAEYEGYQYNDTEYYVAKFLDLLNLISEETDTPEVTDKKKEHTSYVTNIIAYAQNTEIDSLLEKLGNELPENRGAILKEEKERTMRRLKLTFGSASLFMHAITRYHHLKKESKTCVNMPR